MNGSRKGTRTSPSPVRYANWQSRLLLKSVFARQFGLPETPPPALEHFLKWVERRMSIDLSDVEIDRPIFLFGLPRSGTTLVQDLLCSLPQVGYFTNTMNAFRHCFCAAEAFRRKLRLNAEGERYIGDSVVVSATTPNDGVAFWGELFRQDLSLDYRPQPAARLAPADVETFRTAIRKALWCQTGSTRFFCKLLGVFPQLQTVAELFPDARYVHVVRDPRMTANSMIKLYQRDIAQQERFRRYLRRDLPEGRHFVPYPRFPRLAEYAETYGLEDVRTTAGLWNDAMDFLAEIRPTLPAFYEVRYEDVLANPREEITRIIDFCQLPVPDACDTAFWNRLGNVGKVHHANRYKNFDIIEDVCRGNMRRYRYL